MVMTICPSNAKILWCLKKHCIYTNLPENLEKREGKWIYWGATSMLGTLYMIFDLFSIIILGSWDYKPHFIEKEIKNRDAGTKSELRWAWPNPKLFPDCTFEPLWSTQIFLPYLSIPRKRGTETSQGSIRSQFQREELSVGSIRRWKSSAFPWECPLFFVEKSTTLPRSSHESGRKILGPLLLRRKQCLFYSSLSTKGQVGIRLWFRRKTARRQLHRSTWEALH